MNNLTAYKCKYRNLYKLQLGGAFRNSIKHRFFRHLISLCYCAAFMEGD